MVVAASPRSFDSGLSFFAYRLTNKRCFPPLRMTKRAVPEVVFKSQGISLWPLIGQFDIFPSFLYNTIIMEGCPSG